MRNLAETCRQQAAECFRDADAATTPGGREAFIRMAEKWTALAERIERQQQAAADLARQRAEPRSSFAFLRYLWARQ